MPIYEEKHLWSQTVLSYYTLDCSLDIHSHCLLPTQTLIEPQWECNLENGHQMALKKVYLYSKKILPKQSKLLLKNHATSSFKSN